MLLSLVAMDPPEFLFPAKPVRNEKVKLLEAMRILHAGVGARATRCAASTVRAEVDGKACPRLPARNRTWTHNSTVETFAAMKPVGRQLAVGRCSFLPSLRQAARKAEHGNRRPFQERPAGNFSGDNRERLGRPESPDHSTSSPRRASSLQVRAKIPGPHHPHAAA